MRARSRGLLIAVCLLLVLLIAVSIYLLTNRDDLLKIQHRLAPREEHVDFAEASAPDHDIYAFSALPDDPRVTVDQSMLMVNADHGLPADFVPELVEYRTSGVDMNRAMTDAYGALSDHIINVLKSRMYVSSVYRTREEQEELYAMDPAIAQVPGHSEHETGLAADVYVAEYAGMNFINSETGRFVNDNCWRFGFIIRYPEGKESITGIGFEPWHLRYIGQPHATIMADKWWTLEEYYDHVEPGKWYRSGFYKLGRFPADSVPVPRTGNVTISPDNTGYVFVTVEFDEQQGE